MTGTVRHAGAYKTPIAFYKAGTVWMPSNKGFLRRGGVWQQEFGPPPLSVGWYDTPRNSTTYANGGVEFADCNIGPANPYRWVVACVSMSANQSLTNVLINGIAAEIIVQFRHTGGSPDKHAIMARLKVPTGTTCTVKVDTPGAVTGVGVCVLAVTGGEETIYYTATTDTITLTGPAKPNLMLYTHTRNGASSVTLTGMTQIANVNINGYNQSVGYLLNESGGTFTKDANTDAGRAGAILI